MPKTAQDKLHRSIARALVARVVMAVQGSDTSAYIWQARGSRRPRGTYAALVTSVRADGISAGVFINASSSPHGWISVSIEAEVPGLDTQVLAVGRFNTQASVWAGLADAEAMALSTILRIQKEGL